MKYYPLLLISLLLACGHKKAAEPYQSLWDLMGRADVYDTVQYFITVIGPLDSTQFSAAYTTPTRYDTQKITSLSGLCYKAITTHPGVLKPISYHVKDTVKKTILGYLKLPKYLRMNASWGEESDFLGADEQQDFRHKEALDDKKRPIPVNYFIVSCRDLDGAKIDTCK
jgi:hypothetical protein